MCRIGICDKNISYAIGLSDYINYREGQYSAVIFTDKEAAASYLKENDLDLILMDDITGCEATDRGLFFHNIRCMCLSERRPDTGFYMLGERGSRPSVCEKDMIFKYQSLTDVFGQLKKEIPAYPPAYSNVQVEAVFSPIGRSGCTTLAKALAGHTAGGRGIYVGMENYSPYEVPGGGILYQIKERIPGLSETVRGYTISSEGVDMLFLSTIYIDSKNVQRDDITCLTDCLLQSGGYDLVVYDVGSAVPDDLSILDSFDRIYMPVLDDDTSAGKLNHFENVLRSMEYRSIMAKIVRVRVPYYRIEGEEMAAFVRSLKHGES